MIIPRRYIPFWNFTDYTPTIPKLYWDVRSQEQRILNLFELVNKVICYADYIGTDIDDLIDMVNELSARLDTVLDEVEEELQETKDWVNDRINGLIDEIYQECLRRFTDWLDEHMPEIIGKAAQMVFFGLTLEGHFVAYIPQGYAWDDIEFDTGMDYSLETYGRLILRYDVDQTETVDQTPEQRS